jgi:hypothetical protein
LTDFDLVWQRIVALQGETFRQKTGRSFSYAIRSGCVVPSTTNRQLPRSQFARAYERAPLRGPGQLQDLQGPSYLFAILADPRVGDVGGMTTPRQARLPGSAGRAGILAPKAGYPVRRRCHRRARPAGPGRRYLRHRLAALDRGRASCWAGSRHSARCWL